MVLTVPREHKETQDLQAQLEHQELRDQRVRLEHLEQMDLKAQKVTQDQSAQLDHKDLKDLQEIVATINTQLIQLIHIMIHMQLTHTEL